MEVNARYIIDTYSSVLAVADITDVASDMVIVLLVAYGRLEAMVGSQRD